MGAPKDQEDFFEEFDAEEFEEDFEAHDADSRVSFGGNISPRRKKVNKKRTRNKLRKCILTKSELCSGVPQKLILVDMSWSGANVLQAVKQIQLEHFYPRHQDGETLGLPELGADK